MLDKHAVDPNRRAKLRRLALIVFLWFCAVSAVIHFTVGSLVAMLAPRPQAPPTDQQVVSIITITHLVPEQRKQVTPTPIEQRRIAMRDVTHFDPVKDRVIPRKQPKITAPWRSSPTPADASASRSSIAFSSVPKRQRSSPKSVAAVTSPSGANPVFAQSGTATANGAGTGTSVEDQNYPGRQIPTGAVWSENGPPGQSASPGGITLGGGGGGIGHGGHDSCSPGRGDFF